jgi:hypothetical protein
MSLVTILLILTAIVTQNYVNKRVKWACLGYLSLYGKKLLLHKAILITFVASLVHMGSIFDTEYYNDNDKINGTIETFLRVPRHSL